MSIERTYVIIATEQIKVKKISLNHKSTNNIEASGIMKIECNMNRSVD